MKSGFAPGAAEVSWDLGAGGCLSGSHSVGAGCSWGQEEAWSMELLALTCAQVVHSGLMGSLLLATCAAFRHVIPGQILSYVEELGVRDLILLPPPFCPWGVMHAELRRQVLAAGQ